MPNPSSFVLSKIKLGLTVVVLLAVLAVLTFLASAWGESNFEAGPVQDRELVEFVADSGVEVLSEGEWIPISEEVSLSSGSSFRTDSNSELGVFFRSADLIRLYPGTELTFEVVDFDSSPMVIDLVLTSGSVWVSDIQAIVDITVTTDRVRLEPKNAAAFVDYTEGEVTLFSAHHSTRVSFLSEMDEAGEQTVLNDYLLTESHEVSIHESSLSNILSQLRYTKLTKEYPFSFVDESDWEDEWTIALESDLDRLADVYAEFISTLRRQGSAGYEEGSMAYRVTTAYRAIRSVLTFSDEHLMRIEDEDELEVLYQALYLILEGDEAAVERLQRFEKLAENFDSMDKLEPLVQIFQAVNYGSDFYPVKNLLRDLRLSAASDEEYLPLALQFLRERLNEVYDLLDSSDLNEAKDALETYNQVWQDLISETGIQLADVVQVLTEERQILQNLLYREAIFYEVDSYEVLTTLEDRILTLTAEEYDLNEERQAFVQDKIRILIRLIDLIDDGLVNLDKGTDLGHDLISDSEDLLGDITSETAVMDYFVSKLSELTLMLQFINSTDYLLGEGTFDDKFEVYLDKEDELSDLSDYIIGLSTGDIEETEITLDEALDEVEASFDEAGVTYLALLPLGDTEYRLFSIEGGRVGGIDFEGNYDRETGIVYDLQVEGETFSTGLKLENLRDAVQGAIDATSTMEEGEEEVEEELVDLSPVEELAITLIQRTLETETKLTFEDGSVSIVDLEANLFMAEMTIVSRNDQIWVQFQYDAENNTVFNVIGVVEDVQFDVDVEELSELVEAIVEAWEEIS